MGGLPRTRRRSVHDSRSLSRAPLASLRDRLRRPLAEPVCRQVRQLSGSGEGSGQNRVLSQRRGDLGDGEQDQPLTATVTATAAPTAYSSDQRQRITPARSAPTGDMSGLKSRRSGPVPFDGSGGARRVPEMSPNCHQQASDCRWRHPPNLKETRALNPRATHGNTLVMRRSALCGWKCGWPPPNPPWECSRQPEPVKGACGVTT